MRWFGGKIVFRPKGNCREEDGLLELSGVGGRNGSEHEGSRPLRLIPRCRTAGRSSAAGKKGLDSGSSGFKELSSHNKAVDSSCPAKLFFSFSCLG